MCAVGVQREQLPGVPDGLVQTAGLPNPNCVGMEPDYLGV